MTGLLLLLPRTTYAENLLEDIKHHRLVAHALGAVDGLPYSNSKEAFELSYSRGLRLFEADLIISADEVLVARHSWSRRSYELLQQKLPETPLKQKLTHKVFLQTPIFGRFTPLDIRALLLLLKEYPDAYLTTDTKYLSVRSLHLAFSQLATLSSELGVKDRIIPQIYNEKTLRIVRETYGFKNVFYTLYREKKSDEEILSLISKHGLLLITIPVRRLSVGFIQDIRALGALPFTYTINDAQSAATYFGMGIHGLYTDTLTPEEIAPLTTVSEASPKRN